MKIYEEPLSKQQRARSASRGGMDDPQAQAKYRHDTKRRHLMALLGWQQKEMQEGCRDGEENERQSLNAEEVVQR